MNQTQEFLLFAQGAKKRNNFPDIVYYLLVSESCHQHAGDSQNFWERQDAWNIFYRISSETILSFQKIKLGKQKTAGENEDFTKINSIESPDHRQTQKGLHAHLVKIKMEIV